MADASEADSIGDVVLADSGDGFDALDGRSDAGAGDASLTDAGTDGAIDAGPDAPSRDAGDDVPLRDAGDDVPIRDAGDDAPTPPRADQHVHIEVSNTCEMTVTPRELDVPPGQTLYLDWHNHSRDYPVDVWMSYGGGFTDLAPGRTWDEPIGHCSTPFVGDEYADISTACSSFRFLIHCL